MNVGLLAVDALIPNLALMRLSAWHKAQGDSAEVAFPLAADTYDRVYRSKQFAYTPDDMTPWPCEVIDGGTGYDLDARLTDEQDATYPDYDLYRCTYALGRFTRGCPRGCPFCVVGKMDGTRVRQVADLSAFWRGQEYLRLIDDNLTAMPDLFLSVCSDLAEKRVRVKFESLDIRFMDTIAAAALARVRRWGRVHFAWDRMADEAAIREGIANLAAGGFPLYAATFYVLIGYDTTPEEDTHRLETLDRLGVEVFVMPFDKSDPYQKRLARSVNRKEVWRTTHPRHVPPTNEDGGEE